MNRFLSLCCVLAVACCDPTSTGSSGSSTSSSSGTGGASGYTTSGTGGSGAACGLYPVAPVGTPSCGGDGEECGGGLATVEEADAFCVTHFAGNYCRESSCEYASCLRGRCRPTEIDGHACDRDAMCSNEHCINGTCGGVGAPDGGCLVCPDAG